MLQVTCAIIEHADKILICQRSTSMKLPLKWEFPGGKIEPGESKGDCLRREIKEELDIENGISRSEITSMRLLTTIHFSISSTKVDS